MKRISKQHRRTHDLERRLELVRSTVRVLTPTELGQVDGGSATCQGPQQQQPNRGCVFWPFTG